MKQNVALAIYEALLGNHWLDISYKNKENETTYYYVAIKDINPLTHYLSVLIFNQHKSKYCLDHEVWIDADNVITATVIEQSYYPTSKFILDRLNHDADWREFLHVELFDNNILRYLSECYRNDNDPYIKNAVMIDGIDYHVLLNKQKYHLNDKQFSQVLEGVFNKSPAKAEESMRYQILAFNIFSIDIDNKQFVVAYRPLTLNFQNRTLKLGSKTEFNKSFIINDTSISLNRFLDIDPEEFISHFDENPRYYIDLIQEQFKRGEKVNTRPSLFLLKKDVSHGVEETFQSINELEEERKLTVPLKSFFGSNKSRGSDKKEVNIVVFDKNKINIDQMRVVYNAMINHVTYVQGPPGTGKTETIFNVLLSAYTNNLNVLVCSNNNHPVNDISKKILQPFTFKSGFLSKEESFCLPILRLGNNDEMVESLKRIKEAFSFAKKHEHTKISEASTIKNKDKILNQFNELKDVLVKYENRQEIIESLEKLKKISAINVIPQIKEKILEQEKINNEKLLSIGEITNEDVTKYAISAKDNYSFAAYLYYSSLERYLHLNSQNYNELRIICNIENTTDAVVELNKYLKDDKNLKRLITVFPIIISTNVSSFKLGSPKPNIFDLGIMDEAGQCNIATSLIPIVRCKNLLLVGDTNQLQPVTVIEESLNESLMEKYNIKKEYNYVKNSILSTMLAKDTNSKRILLTYHYRCGKKIAEFSNRRFYQNHLKLMNNGEGNLQYINVKNKPIADFRNAYQEEAQQIVKIIADNNYQDVGIITPFVNQATLLNRYLKEAKIDNVHAGTVHTLQGSEKDVIIMSTALSYRTGQKTMEWIKNNHELINVAVTRAKKFFIFAGDKDAIDALSHNDGNDIKALSDYVASNGAMTVPSSTGIMSLDFSNDSDSEKQFFETVRPYFTRSNCKFQIEHNVSFSKAIPNALKEDKRKFNNREFDVIVKATDQSRTYKTIIAFEIDGGEHIGNSKTIISDREKENVCKKYGIKLIRIANNQVKDYELIIKLFEGIVRDIRDIDALDTISLLDD